MRTQLHSASGTAVQVGELQQKVKLHDCRLHEGNSSHLERTDYLWSRSWKSPFLSKLNISS